MAENTLVIALAVIAIVAIVAVFGLVQMTGYVIKERIREPLGYCYVTGLNLPDKKEVAIPIYSCEQYFALKSVDKILCPTLRACEGGGPTEPSEGMK
ncbi:MAG: hypothetical protein J7K22_00985 [Nanoarchaeota archaeon]|nr:hypothetical protein [Nanoarchaeota archaeon]